MRGFKVFLKQAFPFLLPPYRAARRVVANRFLSMDSVFGGIYRANAWGNAESVSGCGSSLPATAQIREVLPSIVKDYHIRSIVDAPCGDFNWMKEVALDLDQYTGVDIVPELIENNRLRHGNKRRAFRVGDLTADTLPKADLIICRDCLIHFSYRHAFAALRNFRRSRGTYLLTTTYNALEANRDIVTGSYRPINLRTEPFGLPEPIAWFPEDPVRLPGGEEADPRAGRGLGLWKVSDIPLEG
jgi:hypothetical protein